MYKVVGLTLSLLVLATLVGCGSKAESLTKKLIADMNKLADAVEAKNKSDVEAITKDMKELAAEMEKIKPSKEEEAALEKKYGEQMKEATEKLGKAMMKAAAEGFSVEGLNP
jgi:biopolymer transport protein ExbB/TolQ